MKNIYILIALGVFTATNAQLTLVKQLSNAEVPKYEDVELPQIFNNKMYYIGKPANPQECKLYVTDGTSAGTQLLKDLGTIYTTGNGNYSTIGSFNQTADRLYFLRSQHLNPSAGGAPTEMTTELWVTDGTTAGTLKLMNKTTPVVNYSAVSPISLFGRGRVQELNDNFAGNKLIFTAYDPASATVSNGNQIAWVTDGTVAGTQPLLTAGGEKIYGGGTGGTKVNGEYFFAGRSQVTTDQGGFLYKTNGNTSGTVKVNPSASNWFVGSHFSKPLNGQFLFWATDNLGPSWNQQNYEIWKSDGTAAGTQLFYETASGADSKKPYYGNVLDFVNDGQKFYFMLKQDPANNEQNEVWTTDGTLSNTKKIRDATNYLVDYTIVSNGHIFFEEFIQSPSTFRLVHSDGTASGTTVVSTKNTNRPSFSLYQGAAYYKDFDQMVPYFSNQVADNMEVWRSDGTVGNTARLLDVLPGTTTVSSYTISNSSKPTNFFILGDSLYFVTENPKNLYKFKGDYTFNNSVNGNWSNPANWNAGVLPGFTDPVNVPLGYNVNMDATGYAGNLNLNSSLNLASGNLNVGGNLNLGSSITLNAQSLILGPAAQVTNGNPTNYIVTNGTGTVNVENLNAARGAITLPIGTSTNFNPVTISNSGTSDTFSARVSEGISNAPNGAVNATWDISEGTAGGSNVSLNFVWNAAQQNVNFSAAGAMVGHYYNGQWNQENSGSVTGSGPFSITASGISSFSPFGIMNFGALATVESFHSKLSVYPNPFYDVLSIMAEEKGWVEFFDLSGKMTGRHRLEKGENRSNKDALNPGIYVYRITNDSGMKVASGKIIKK